MWLARSVARFSTQEIAAVSSHLMMRAVRSDPRSTVGCGLRCFAGIRPCSTRPVTPRGASIHAQWVGKLAQPAMVVLTGRDQIMEPAAQRELAGLLEAAEVVELPAAGHESILSDAPEWVGLIKRFAG